MPGRPAPAPVRMGAPVGVPRLHVVTDDAVLARPGFTDTAGRLLAAGGPGLALHLRGHGTEAGRLYALTAALAAPARDAGALLLVNDRVDIALAAGAAGVQLGRRSLPPRSARALLPRDARIGYSAHAGEEARSAVEGGADFVVLGSVFPSASHPDRAGMGTGMLREAEAGAPIIAIGGVSPERVGEVLSAGAHGVAVLSGVWSAPDPEDAVRRYLSLLAKHAEEHG